MKEEISAHESATTADLYANLVGGLRQNMRAGLCGYTPEAEAAAHSAIAALRVLQVELLMIDRNAKLSEHADAIRHANAA